MMDQMWGGGDLNEKRLPQRALVTPAHLSPSRNQKGNEENPRSDERGDGQAAAPFRPHCGRGCRVQTITMPRQKLDCLLWRRFCAGSMVDRWRCGGWWQTRPGGEVEERKDNVAWWVPSFIKPPPTYTNLQNNPY